MARVLEEIPQEMDMESSETDAMLRGPSEPRRCSRTSLGLALLGVSMLAMVIALALPQEHHLRKSHESVIGLDDDSIWASVLSSDAMKQYQKQKAKSEDAVDHAKSSAEQAWNDGAASVEKATSDMASNLNTLLSKPKEKAEEASDKVEKAAQDFEGSAQNSMEAVQSAADQVKSVLNIGLPQAPAPAPAAPAPVATVPPISLPPAPKIQMPTMPTIAPAVTNAANSLVNSVGSAASSASETASAKADKMKSMADEFLKEASNSGISSQQKAQLESLANMLKKDADKLGGTASAAAGSVAAAVAPPAAPAPAAVQTVTDDPSESPLAPQESDTSGDPCVDDEEHFGGLCYKKCAVLSGGSHPCRSSAWSCCAVPSGPGCAAKASFGNCWIHMGFCGGYSVSGDAEAENGNHCPTSEGGCLTDEELLGDTCYKKCSLLTPQYPHRVAASSCCSKPGGFDCFWPTNLHTDPAFNVGGGAGDHNSGTPNTPHSPMLQLSQ